MEGKNETLYWVYIWFTFEGDLNGVRRRLLYMAVWNVILNVVVWVVLGG